jgi:uncharacterized protein HemY
MEATIAVDQGRLQEAIRILDQLQARTKLVSPALERVYRGASLSLRSYNPDPDYVADLKKYVSDVSEAYKAADFSERNNEGYNLLAAGSLAARAGDVALASEAQVARDDEQPVIAGMAAILDAEISLAQGQPQQAVSRLDALVASGAEPYASHSVRLRAYLEAKRWDDATHETDWLISHRGLAYVELNNGYLWQATNVAESDLALLTAAKLAERAGQKELTKRRRAAFQSAWPGSEKLSVVTTRSRAFDR